ncbi:MAG: nucleotidyltransferase domain-containing protein [Candidatus Bathycorpusculaceae bacterium]
MREIIVELVSLTPEGKVVLVLSHGKHTYKELKIETGLSDRWLTFKLGELESKGVIKKSGKWYSLAHTLDVTAYELSLFMGFQAKRMADELAKLPFVETIVLFGGVVQKRANALSDLDLIIVVDEPFEEAKKKVLLKISELEREYHVMIEPLILTEADFLDNVYSNEGGIIYGVAEGFEVLVDKTGKLAKILHERVEEIRRSHEYLREARIWLKIK